MEPEEEGKGPTMAMFMCENLFSGMEKCSSGFFVCFALLNFGSDDILSPIY